MSDLREAAQQALDALAGYRREMDLVRGESYMHGQPCDAEIALRAALGQEYYVVTGNEFHGAPPEPYANWGDAIAAMLDRGVIRGLRISALAQQAEPVQEPVAWMCPDDPERETAFHWQAGHCENCGKKRIPLYTALVQDQDPELSAALGWPGGISDPVLDRETLLQQVARLVERAHGIEEEE